MLTVTEHAKVTLARLKRQCQIEDDDVALRLSLAASSSRARASSGCAWIARALGDQVVEYGGTKVLLVEEGRRTRCRTPPSTRSAGTI